MPKLDDWTKKQEEKLLNSLILESTKNGTLVWKRRWASIYRYVAYIGQYRLGLLDEPNDDWHTIYISLKGVKKDLYADGKQVWYLLTGQKETTRPDRKSLITELTELQKRGNT